jgi:hypothetical protein
LFLQGPPDEDSALTRKNVKLKAKESSWISDPNFQIPVYSSETDPHCPRAVKRTTEKYKSIAVIRAEKGEGASEWIESTIKKKYDEFPVKETSILRERAAASAIRDESITEVEILQKIIVRENLLMDLKKLLQYQVELETVLKESVELIRAIRYQTLEVVEEVQCWKMDMKAPREFFYRGENYLLKVCMYVCICICVCMCMCVYVSMYVQMYICIYICMYVYTHVHVMYMYTCNVHM